MLRNEAFAYCPLGTPSAGSISPALFLLQVGGTVGARAQGKGTPTCMLRSPGRPTYSPLNPTLSFSAQDPMRSGMVLHCPIKQPQDHFGLNHLLLLYSPLYDFIHSFMWVTHAHLCFYKVEAKFFNSVTSLRLTTRKENWGQGRWKAGFSIPITMPNLNVQSWTN